MKTQDRGTSGEVMTNKGQNIFFERMLLESKAYLALKTPTAVQVLSLFFTKRQLEPIGRKGKDGWRIKNNGQIEFTYLEAQNKYRFSVGKFRTAIDDLIDKGFIDIESSGGGTYKVKTLYRISNRWRNYDTTDYEQPKPRPKKPINGGFKKGNQYGRNCNKEKKSTVVHQHSVTVTNQHGEPENQ